MFGVLFKSSTAITASGTMIGLFECSRRSWMNLQLLRVESANGILADITRDGERVAAAVTQVSKTQLDARSAFYGYYGVYELLDKATSRCGKRSAAAC